MWHFSVVIVGGGQAGLSASYYLKEQGVDHVLLDKHSPGHSWRAHRWDSFCLVTPNWQCDLPGYPYAGYDPYGFMKRDEIAEYVENYAAAFDAPLRTGVEVTRVRRDVRCGVFIVETSDGTLTAENVISATGGYHVPHMPALAERMPDEVVQLHSSTYRNPESLPEGDVLVVGTGQSGCQIAEDLHRADRHVHLCVGGAPRTPRMYRGRDAVEWLHDMGHYDLTVDQHPEGESVRAEVNHYVTGRDGGREIDLRHFALQGMELYGRLHDMRDGRLVFNADLEQNLDYADSVAERIKKTIDKYILEHKIDAPTEPPCEPVWRPAREREQLDLASTNIRSVIWCTGFHADFRWLQVPAFDGTGYPTHWRGVTNVPGLYVLGLPWLYTWGSGRFSGVGRDARHVVGQILARRSQRYAFKRQPDYGSRIERRLGLIPAR